MNTVVNLEQPKMLWQSVEFLELRSLMESKKGVWTVMPPRISELPHVGPPSSVTSLTLSSPV